MLGYLAQTRGRHANDRGQDHAGGVANHDSGQFSGEIHAHLSPDTHVLRVGLVASHMLNISEGSMVSGFSRARTKASAAVAATPTSCRIHRFRFHISDALLITHDNGVGKL